MAQQQQPKWITGPCKTSLGKLADVELAEGYRLTDASGARQLLERMKNAAPKGLVGLLAPDSGAWFVILEFSEAGYVKTFTNNVINADGVLSVVREKMESQSTDRTKKGAAALKSVNWELPPAFDEASHSLECALRIEAQTGVVVNHSIRLLARNGVLVATAVRTVQSGGDAIPLKDLVKNITFKEGQRYEDFQTGDRIASGGITQLLIGEDAPSSALNASWFSNLSKRTRIWIVCGLAVGVLFVVGCLVYGEIRSLKLRESFPVHSSDNGANGNVSANGHSLRRKRVFNYQKFYSEMLMERSTRPYTAPFHSQPEESAETAAAAELSPMMAEQLSPLAVQNATSELIAQQKELIEEQRRLMQQQSKMIEERSRLIEEKNQLLAKQSEMIESHLL